MTWSKEEMERECTDEEEIRSINNKRSGESGDESIRSNHGENDIDTDVEGCSSLTRSDKQQKLVRRAGEGDNGTIRQNTSKEQVRRQSITNMGRFWLNVGDSQFGGNCQ